MRLGVLEKPYRQQTFDYALEKIKSFGYDEITIGSLGMSNLPNDHCNAGELIEDEKKFKQFMDVINKHSLKVSTIQCTANPLHPQKKIAERFDKELKDCIVLAAKMGVDNVSTFSGCPGDNLSALYPNWVAYSWPFDHGAVLKWQWEEVLIPYWKNLVKFAKNHGINKIGLEFHPNFCVYNPKTLFKLREEVGEEIGACLDVSHLYWMGMDPVIVIRELKDCIFQFHAKDTLMNTAEIKKNGVIDNGLFSDLSSKPWRFTVPGYGHGFEEWARIIATLQEIEYDGAITFEHEDVCFSRDEGLEKNFNFLNSLIIREPADRCYWTKGVKEARFEHLNI